MKKILILIFISLFISCSSVSAKSKFNEKKYLESISIIVKQLNKDSSKGKTDLEKVKEYEEIANSISFIHNDEYLQKSYINILEYWGVLYIIKNYDYDIQKNSKLESDLSKIDIYFNQSTAQLKAIVEKNKNSLQKLLEIEDRIKYMTDFVDDIEIRDDKTSNLVNIYHRNLADLYIEIASNFERTSELEDARDYYKDGCEIYPIKDNDGYRKSCSKYVELDIKIVDLNITKLLILANKSKATNNYEDAYEILKQAYDYAVIYPNIFSTQIRNISDNISNIGYNLAESYYYKAQTYYSYGKYYDAYQYYKKASYYYNNYKNSNVLAEKMYELYRVYENGYY